MIIKGTATIELTNADGSKETIKHDNMITNAVNDLCLSQRGEMAAILKMTSNNASYAQSMFGGILLFGDTLNDDANDYEIPTTNIVGYASQDAYAGLDVARGSFNASEGGVQEDGSYKFVWDFATSQANGTIKSLALCPNVMGKIGASTTIVESERASFNFVKGPTEPFNSYGRMLSSDGTTASISNWCFHIAAIVGDIAYAVDYYNLYKDNNYASRSIVDNGGVLKLYKFKLGTESINLADRVAMARYIECIDIQLPNDIINVLKTSYNYYSISYYYNQRDKKLIIFPCSTKSSVSVNGTLPYMDIDLVNNMQITQYTFTNTASGIIATTENAACVSDYDAAYTFFPIEDYIIVISGTGTNKNICIIDRNDNTKVIKAKWKGGDFLVVDPYKYLIPIFVNSNTVIFGLKTSTGSYITDAYILDLNTGDTRKTNAKDFNVKSNVDFGNKVIKVKTGPYLTYYVTINPFILTTKNNLDAPITKTASQTMKITYTLSEVAESGV